MVIQTNRGLWSYEYWVVPVPIKYFLAAPQFAVNWRHFCRFSHERIMMRYNM
ncbi:hypothetical protein M433DRAFT_157557 [Acidomyces richmondensis BFW]|nr:MAG: hypothetical protein FE78DRAFT_89757 [Acidomyces sp. 'richmondensis']KYG42734.1 hypothetical protein M433DRAFT_157557 [Acidomyces richmondensis BFW]